MTYNKLYDKITYKIKKEWYINIYEDITNALEYYNLTFDDVILIGNSGGYIDKIKFIKLAQNTDYNDIENGNIIDIKMISKINSRINY